MRKSNHSGRRKNLLIELGTEELPPKALKILAESFSQSFYQGMVTANLVDDKVDSIKCYATPRRLAVWIKGVLPRQADLIEEKRGPGIQAAYDDQGNPTPAAMGFAKSCGVPVAKLETVKSEKGEWLIFRKKVKGRKLSDIVTHCLEQSIKSLPIPKRMRWGENQHEFVRPVHWLLALYGSDLVKTEVLGLKANRYTRGHRFHCPEQLKIQSADRYSSSLKTNGYVIADYAVRQSTILRQAQRMTAKSGARVVIDQNLLDEVTGLVEWPVALLGEFDKRFLKLPNEVLISTMADHQKYFHVVNDRKKLLPLFVAISNIKSKSPKRVRQGNERVLRARLADAEFFWNKDQETSLEDRVEDLKGVLFHYKLGSIHDKIERVSLLSEHIAREMGINSQSVGHAVRLSKADLVTDMVGEFPALQGVVGKHYALNEGIEKEVANAVDAHYLPRFSGDKIPQQGVSQCVGLADRIDTLVGIFSCNEIPTGIKIHLD